MSDHKSPEGEIQFKPLSEGLGLNHFADGLPYAPSHPRKKAPIPFQYPPPRAPKAFETLAPAPVVVKTEVSVSVVARLFDTALDFVLCSGLYVAIVWLGFKVNGLSFSNLLIKN